MVNFDLSVGFWAIIGIIAIRQGVTSVTDWTVKEGLSWLRNIARSETTDREDKDGNKKAIEIADNLERKIEEKDKEIKKREEKVSNYERIIRGLRSDNISKREIIQSYWRPLPTIIITFFNDYSESTDGKFLKKFIRENNDAEMLTGNTYAIPPKGFPNRFKEPSKVTRSDVQAWIHEDILAEEENPEVAICQVSAVDLRRIYSYSNCENMSFSRKTIDYALDIESILERHNVHRILARDSVNLSKEIENGNIAFFLSRYISDDELEEIHENQDQIRHELGDPPLRTIASDGFEERLADVLSTYISDPLDPSKKAVEEAKLWYEALQEAV